MPSEATLTSISATTSDGLVIRGYEFGGQGHPLLLAHATGFNGHVWQPLAAELADTFTCFSLDFRAHGDSDPLRPESFDWEGFGRDVLAVVDAFDLLGAFAVGHSSGGTAVLLAELARPGTFGGLYCFEPVIVPEDPPLGRDADNWLANAARHRRSTFASRGEAVDHYRSKPHLAELDPACLEAYVAHGFTERNDGSVELKCRREDEALIYEMATAHDCYSRMANVECPVTIACGEESEGRGPACSEAQVGRLRQGRGELLPRLGHLGPLEDTKAVADSIRRAFR